MRSIQEDNDTIYMFEDKEPSFTKLTSKQYFDAGEKEVSKSSYEHIVDDPIKNVKDQVRNLVDRMKNDDEISEKSSWLPSEWGC